MDEFLRWWLGVGVTAVFLVVGLRPETAVGAAVHTYHFPIVATAPSPDPLPPPVALSGAPPLDFTALQEELDDQGLKLAFNKIGFHHGISGLAGDDPEFVAMLEALDAAGVPFFLKSTDNAQPLYIAQELMRQSGVPHTLVYRRVSGPDGSYDVPDYNKTPQAAAQEHWQKHMALFPPELDPDLIWIETMNEVDKNRSEWLAEFALETAELARRDGFRWAAFGWSTGEPEAAHWRGPKMREFLRLAARHPDRLGIALHEYSLVSDRISRWYPDLVGRFQALYQVCDEYGIGRPSVFITEWGWEYQTVPTAAEAVADIAWAARLYAAYPQVKGAAIWYLGGGFGGIADDTRLLIAPLRAYSLSHYFAYTPGRGRIDPSLFWTSPPTR